MYPKPIYPEEIAEMALIGGILVWIVIFSSCGENAKAFYHDTETETEIQDTEDTEIQDTEDTETDTEDTETDTENFKCPWECIKLESNPKITCDYYKWPGKPESIWNPYFVCEGDFEICCQPVGSQDPGALDTYCYDLGKNYICGNCEEKEAVKAFCYNAGVRCCEISK